MTNLEYNDLLFKLRQIVKERQIISNKSIFVTCPICEYKHAIIRIRRVDNTLHYICRDCNLIIACSNKIKL